MRVTQIRLTQNLKFDSSYVQSVRFSLTIVKCKIKLILFKSLKSPESQGEPNFLHKLYEISNQLHKST